MLSTQEIKARLSLSAGFEGSIKELSNHTGIPEKTLYRNRNSLNDYGITVIKCKRGPKGNKPKLLSVDLPLTSYKVLLNALHYNLGLSVPYGDSVVPFTAYSDYRTYGINRKIYIQYLKDVLSKCKKLPVDDRALILETIYQLSTPHICLSPAEEQCYTNLSQELFGITPTKEQLRVINSIVKYATNKTLRKVTTVRVEAVAGASKSFCAAIAKRALEEYHGFDKIEFLSISSSVADGNLDGKTIAKYLKEGYDFSGSFEEIQSVRKFINVCQKTKNLVKEKFLIIDEHSTLSRDHIELFSLLSEKVLFLGDTAQIRRNDEYLGPVIGVLSKQYRFLNSKTDYQEVITRLHTTGQHKALEEYLYSIAKGTFTGKLSIRVNNRGAEVYTDYTNSFNEIYEAHKDIIHSLNTIVLTFASKAVKEFNILANGGEEIKAGSIVTLTKYEYKAGEAGKTGGRFKVLKRTGSKCILFSHDKGTIEAPVSSLELSFAATTSKVQGRSFDTVIFLGGTSCISDFNNDCYSGCTRAKIELILYLRSEVDRSRLKLLSILLPFVEGKRNDKLNRDLFVFFKEALSVGMTPKEILATTKSALTGATGGQIEETIKIASKILNKVVCGIAPQESPEEITDNFGYVLVKADGTPIYPKAEQRNKTRKEAQYLLDTTLKQAKYKDGFITRDLLGSNLIVVDCDNKEAVDMFYKYKDLTQSSINQEETSMHLVFKVDEYFKRKITHKSARDGVAVDILANSTRSLQNFKSNKVMNTLDPLPIPLDVREKLELLFNGDIYK